MPERDAGGEPPPPRPAPRAVLAVHRPDPAEDQDRDVGGGLDSRQPIDSDRFVTSIRDDVIDTFDHVWQRFRQRMGGLGGEEWRWQPTADDRVTVRWRLGHLAAMLLEERNDAWLGVSVGGHERAAAATARESLADIERGYERVTAALRMTTDASLAEPIGAQAGQYGAASRLSFALHLLDEFIHHTAEAALLRDLYAGRR